MIGIGAVQLEICAWCHHHELVARHAGKAACDSFGAQAMTKHACRSYKFAQRCSFSSVHIDSWLVVRTIIAEDQNNGVHEF